MDNTSTNILARMEDRRKELVGKACEELSKWENCLNKSTEEKEKYSGKPEKLEEYAIAETKANAARENINQLKLDIKICLVKNGYPPQYSPEVFSKVMEQVENFEENSGFEDRMMAYYTHFNNTR